MLQINLTTNPAPLIKALACLYTRKYPLRLTTRIIHDIDQYHAFEQWYRIIDNCIKLIPEIVSNTRLAEECYYS